jgi:hypothetical protein
MGCHTWCHEKVERSIEEARRIYIEKQVKQIERWEEIVNNPQDECRVAYEWSQEIVDFSLAVYKRQLQMVEKGLCNIAVFNHQPDKGAKYISGKGFYRWASDFRGNPFRIGGYPENQLFSYQETLDFIKKYEEKYNTIVELHEGENGLTFLKEFWDAHPDGMIEFG